jgi:hypothetical protein
MRDIGISHILQRLDRPAAAGAVDHADQRQAIFVRHRFALDELAVQRRIGRAAAHGEIVGAGDHRPAIDIGPPEDEIGRRQIFEFAIGAIRPPPRDLADLAKAARIDDRREPRARVHLAAAVLARDLLFAAHLFGHRAPRGKLVDFLFPAHADQASLR